MLPKPPTDIYTDEEHAKLNEINENIVHVDNVDFSNCDENKQSDDIDPVELLKDNIKKIENDPVIQKKFKDFNKQHFTRENVN